MKDEFEADLTKVMSSQGFVVVANATDISDVALILKRQTWNTNRAVVVVRPSETPTDIGAFLKIIRKHVSSKCGFFPFFWGLGIQVVVVAPGLSKDGADPARHIAQFDNQWSIIQSCFFVDSARGTFREARTWGQVVTGKFQDAISTSLSRHFQSTIDTKRA